MTEPLSPAAQAVFSAWAKPVDIARSLVISGQALEFQARGALAAALRAAVEIYLEDGNGEGPQWLLAIADELENADA
jgi:hypothetical protein